MTPRLCSTCFAPAQPRWFASVTLFHSLSRHGGLRAGHCLRMSASFFFCALGIPHHLYACGAVEKSILRLLAILHRALCPNIFRPDPGPCFGRGDRWPDTIFDERSGDIAVLHGEDDVS